MISIRISSPLGLWHHARLKALGIMPPTDPIATMLEGLRSAGLSQTEISRESGGVSRQTLHRYTVGHSRAPTLEFFAKSHGSPAPTACRFPTSRIAVDDFLSRTNAVIAIERGRRNGYTLVDIARATGFDRGKVSRLLRGLPVEDEAGLCAALVRFGTGLAAEGKPLSAKRWIPRPAGGVKS